MRISNVKMLPISNANSNLGLATLVLATLATLATFAASALPLTWRADWPDAKPVETLVHRGTDVELRPLWRINKEPADTNGWTFTTFCQTNAVGPWFGPMPGAFFSHTNDVGAAFYNVMVRAQTPGGAVNYTAFARLRMLDSPGYTPRALPLPAKSIDFDDVATYNAPWLLPDATNDFARAGDIAPTITNTVTKQFVESLGIDAGTTNYADLANKPAVNGVTLAGDKTASALGLASAADVQALQAFYLAEKRKTDPRFGVATNVSVVIDTEGVRHEEVTEGYFLPPTDYDAMEIYLAPTVTGIMGSGGSGDYSATTKIVAYGNIEYIQFNVFQESWDLELLSLSGNGQTDEVAREGVDFSACNHKLLVVIPDAYYEAYSSEGGSTPSFFWTWADGFSGNSQLHRWNLSPASIGTMNPYVVRENEEQIHAPVMQLDGIWTESFGVSTDDESPSRLENISAETSGWADPGVCNRDYTSKGIMTKALRWGGDGGYGDGFHGVDTSTGFTVELTAVVYDKSLSHFTNLKMGGFAILNGNQAWVTYESQIAESETYNYLNGSYYDQPFCPRIVPLVLRADENGCVLHRFDSLGMCLKAEGLPSSTESLACSINQLELYNENTDISFCAFRVYDHYLTDEQVMRHFELDSKRFNIPANGGISE